MKISKKTLLVADVVKLLPPELTCSSYDSIDRFLEYN